MRLALACLALLAIAASPRGGCGKPPYEPCAGKDCGAACTLCPPGDSSCVENTIAKACDPGGACAPAGTFTCQPAPADPCAGKACGDACTVDPPCRSATPPCMVPTLLGHCDADGLCVAAEPSCTPPPPPPGPAPCAGKACHDACDPCPPGATACPAVLCTTWCDGDGRCTCAGGGSACP